jgi:hypothetical protein
MMSWQLRAWNDIIHVAERVFVKGACTPVVGQETIRVPFAIPKDTKQMKSVLRK